VTGELPNPGYAPSHYRTVDYAAGTGFTRVYNRTGARLNGYQALSFNPTSWKQSSKMAGKGGRFDALTDDRFGYLYACDQSDDPTVSIWETLVHKRVAASTGSQLLQRTIFDDYAVRFFSLRQDIKLVDLTDEAALSFFNGSVDAVTRTPDYNQSRQWGRYIRRHTSDCHGFAYTSRRLATQAYGLAVVLFSDRCSRRPVAAIGNPVALTSPRGRRYVDEALLESNIAVLW